MAVSLVASLLLCLLVIQAPSCQAEVGGVFFTVQPEEGAEISNRTPIIVVQYYSEHGVDVESASLIIDGFDVTDLEELVTKNSSAFTYTVPELLSLEYGNHTAVFEIVDGQGDLSSITWTFVVAPATADRTEGPSLQEILIWALIGLILALAVGAAFYLYLRFFKRFTFRKYFLRNPLKKGRLVIVVPVLAALVFVLASMLYVSDVGSEDPFILEYLVVASLFIALFPYALYCHLFGNIRTKYEVAFAQFLFEMADSIRGGIDPARSVVNFAEVDKGLLKKHLKMAADGIRVGRPFDEMIELMVKSIDSPMVKRYASLIGETSKMGGDIAIVLHRAAKDMDDLIKIERDRKRQLNAQAMTIYISFGVLLIVIYQLISIYPMMGNIDGSLFGSGPNLEEAAETAAPSAVMDLVTIKQRFLHLMVINSLGAGILIGVFTDGKPKMGLMHALIMTAASTLFFLLLIIPIS